MIINKLGKKEKKGNDYSKTEKCSYCVGSEVIFCLWQNIHRILMLYREYLAHFVCKYIKLHLIILLLFQRTAGKMEEWLIISPPIMNSHLFSDASFLLNLCPL